MLSEPKSLQRNELIQLLNTYAFRYPSLNPDDYTEWDTQEWFDDDIEEYADVVGEVVERIHRGEMRDADLYRTEARERGIAAGNFDENRTIVTDDDARSFGPRRYSTV